MPLIILVIVKFVIYGEKNLKALKSFKSKRRSGVTFVVNVYVK